MIKLKCINVISKNKGLKVLKIFLKIAHCESINFKDSFVQNYLPDILTSIKYALITCRT